MNRRSPVTRSTARRRTAVPALAGLVVLALTATACAGAGSSGGTSGGDTPFKTAQKGYLTVTYSENYLPKIATGEGGGLAGYEGYLITKLAEKEGLKLKLMPTEFASQVLFVSQGKADIGTGTYYTDKRAEQVFYTRPNINDRLGALMLKSAEWSGPDSLKGKPVASVTGYTYNDYLIKEYGESNVKLFPSYAEAAKATLNKQVAAFMGSTGTAPGIIREHPELTLHPLQKGELGLPANILVSPTHQYVRCDNKELANAVDAVLDDLIKSGQWKKELDRWGVGGAEYLPSADRPAQRCE
ncbi:substrate-binding periplasmic protein [Streptomyces sp. SHP 1-2]|uniref:substrate-binding periplasmic protein n=1 Tax=Streptomyces sp. SHP 1-2 TaxID=2769489 RepID=UPI0022382693|nr:transporter substrate-binding domain-containing protein [Streptomyces sp. SHP 1-2]MCW5251431.1 amino acid ABC transporter substrate-binding protein [Streptomyces sp. SHP 1-2]